MNSATVLMTTWAAYSNALDELELFIDELLGISEDNKDFDDMSVGFDASDWDGISIELTNVPEHISITATQLEVIKNSGFDLLCIHYRGGARARFLTKEAQERSDRFNTRK